MNQGVDAPPNETSLIESADTAGTNAALSALLAGGVATPAALQAAISPHVLSAVSPFFTSSVFGSIPAGITAMYISTLSADFAWVASKGGPNSSLTALWEWYVAQPEPPVTSTINYYLNQLGFTGTYLGGQDDVTTISSMFVDMIAALDAMPASDFTGGGALEPSFVAPARPYLTLPTLPTAPTAPSTPVSPIAPATSSSSMWWLAGAAVVAAGGIFYATRSRAA